MVEAVGRRTYVKHMSDCGQWAKCKLATAINIQIQVITTAKIAKTSSNSNILYKHLSTLLTWIESKIKII